MRLPGSSAYQLGVGLAFAAAASIVWLNAAAGLIGIEDDDPWNLLYVAVLAIGASGAILARFQPRGLAKTLFATAIALVIVGALALVLPNTAGPAPIVLLHVVLAALFAAAGLLFRRAARERVRAGDGG